MKVLFDTNVIIDGLIERDLDYKPARQLIRYAAINKIKGYISAKQITDIYYVLRKYLENELQRKAIIKTILETFEVLPTLKSDIAYSMNSEINDLEDALLDEVCKVNSIDYLITNNIKDYEKAKSIVLTPSQVLEFIELGDR